MYIFQEMIDTERDYVKSLQYVMDVSNIFLTLVFVFLIVIFPVFVFLCSAELPCRNGQACITAIPQRQEEHSVWEY